MHETVCCDVTDSHVGPVWVAVSPRGVCDVALGVAGEPQYRARLARWAPDVRRDPRAAAQVVGELDAWFAGRLTRFSTPVDLTHVTPFTARVCHAAARIGFGALTTYGELARDIGAPGASRAVGGALGRNPTPIIVPCHRVLSHSRRLGGFTGGLKFKRALLRHEGHTLTGAAARERVN